MEKITIEKLPNGGFNVIQGDKYSDMLGYDEMLGLVSCLTMPENRPCIGFMRTKDQHEAWRNSLSPRLPELQPWQKLIEKL
ncbi:hypothetical protein IR083_22950 [Dysgonomonas sp. GY75]|uniref:hypothetical protein n=1 Tax=Dysgonomonas sp. GY75 TaxID=2780419 RepID=UPI0018846EC4|nr:hypothetical protein [Dysgonomonas sp. GY75]MBF0651681.1 hypothetical protein [Dysgonomonas sp. GY75]